MAISLRANGTIALAANAASVAVTVPTVSDGDFMVLTFLAAVNASINTPSGWTLRETRSPFTAQQFAVFTRPALSEPASYTVSVASGTGSLVGQIRTYQSSLGGGMTFDVSASQTNNGTTDTAPSITLTNANEMVVALFGMFANSDVSSESSGLTNLASTGGNSPGYAGLDEVFASSGATGTQQATFTVTGHNAGALISFYETAVRPATHQPDQWNPNWDFGGIAGY